MVSLSINDSQLSSQNTEKHYSFISIYIIIYSKSRSIQIQMPEKFLEVSLTKKLVFL